MPAPRLAAYASTDVGRTRDHNEDTVATASVGAGGASYEAWLVADGMGGGVKGEVASATARDRALATLVAAKDWSDPPRLLRQAMREANAAVFDRGTANGELSRSAMGTTLVLALADPRDGACWLANVGDSRAYIYAGGQLRQVTKDHSLVAEQVAAGIMTIEEAKSPEAPRNVITRAIGTDREVEADIFGPLRLAPGEVLLLCSDGLHGLVADEEVAAILQARPLREAPGALIAAANRAGGSDNITVLVAGWSEGGTATQVELPPAVAVARERRRGVRGYAWIALGLAGIAAIVLTVVLLLAGAGPGAGGKEQAPSPTAAAAESTTRQSTAAAVESTTQQSTPAPATTPAGAGGGQGSR